VRVIAFSLWGRDPKYVVGALRNAALAPTVYPGWICRFYCGASTPSSAMTTLESQPHVQVVRRSEDGDWTAMFWRFLAAADSDVEFAIFRDADSRLGARERAAVEAWIASGRGTHVMRDHPLHAVPILGGMWGVRAGVLPDMASRVAAELSAPRWPNVWQIDQKFLAADIAPIVRHDWLEHDEYFARMPFPTRRRWREYVGQPFDEHDRPLVAGPTALRRRLGQATRGVRRRIASALTWRTTHAC